MTKLHKPSQAPGLLVSGGGDGRVLLWDYVAGKCLQAFDLELLRQAPLVRPPFPPAHVSPYLPAC